MDTRMEFLDPLIDDYDTVVSTILLAFALLCFLFGEDQYKGFRYKDYRRWYRKYGIVCGGVVTDRKFMEGRLYVRYAYRLYNYPATAYIKDFVAAPKELKDDHKNIVVVLVPRRSKSGIHYGILQKINSTGGTIMVIIKAVLFCFPFYLGLFTLPDLEPSTLIFWPYYILLYACIYQIWRIDRSADRIAGINGGVWKTLRRGKSRQNRLASLVWKLDEMEGKSNEDIFLALDRVEHEFCQTMKSLDPCAGAGVTTFSCEKYFSFVQVCQEALQKDSA